MRLFAKVILALLLVQLPAFAEYEFVGRHFMASYKGCDSAALRDLAKLKEALVDAANQSGATILDSVDYTFSPDGLTMVILLSESHASIHTYPEHNACFVDLFTCGTTCSHEMFDKVLKNYLAPTEVNAQVVARD